MRQHREHARDIGANGEEAGLRQAYLSSQQYTISRQAEQRMHADDLNEAEIEIHGPNRLIAPTRCYKNTARPEYKKNEQQQHDVEIALRHAAEKLKKVLKTADNEACDDRARNISKAADDGDDETFDGQRY